MITLEGVLGKYVSRVEFLYIVASIVELELSCKFKEFFELSSFCIFKLVVL